MKKIVTMLLAFAIALQLTGCAAPDQGETKLPVDRIDLKTILYLMEDLTGLELGSYCYQQDITPEQVAMVVGTEDFSLPFESARAYLPTLNVTPFVLCVFRLAPDSDPQEFADALKASAKLDRWICVRAEAAEAEVSGNTVLFFMGNAMLVQPIKDAFAKLAQPDFRAEDHLIDRLAGLTMEQLYEKLYESYSLENYGFMDGKDYGPVTADAGFGLSALDEAQYAESLVDTGEYPADEFDGERSYLLAMFRLTPGTDAAAFAQKLRDTVDASALKGEGQQYVLAWSQDVVIYYVGAGSLAWSNAMLDSCFAGIYRMQTQGVYTM